MSLAYGGIFFFSATVLKIYIHDLLDTDHNECIKYLLLLEYNAKYCSP